MTEILNCPTCNNIMIKIKVKEREYTDCYECRQDDRPFNYGRPNRGSCMCDSIPIIDVIKLLCNRCVEMDKQLALIKWENGIVRKLEFCRVSDLKTFAQRKKIVGCSKMTKTELVDVLKYIVTQDDYPTYGISDL